MMPCSWTLPRRLPVRVPASGVLLSVLALAACKDTRLPDLTISLGGRTTLGTDLNAEDPVFGVTVIDPLRRLPE
jgi:hypothetical protein